MIQRVQWQFVRRNHNETIRRFLKSNANICGSTVYQGKLYENVVLRELSQKLLMDKLTIVGGPRDGGIDLMGRWDISKIFNIMDKRMSLRQQYIGKVPARYTLNGTTFKPIFNTLMEGRKLLPLKVLVQCKAFTSSNISAREIRELAGVAAAMASPKDRNRTIFLMCSPQLITRDGLNLISSVNLPMIYARISLLKRLSPTTYDLTNTGCLVSCFENEYAARLLWGCGVREFLQLAPHTNLGTGEVSSQVGKEKGGRRNAMRKIDDL